MASRRPTLMSVVGARPNFIKLAPLCEELARCGDRLRHVVVHTGQHYDANMSGRFFDELSIPAPDLHLDAGSGSHAVQTARILERFEGVCEGERPDWVIVVGDVNSTLACALVAAKLGIRVAHVEAGLRSFDRRMPEEINRALTDVLSEVLFTTSADADANLVREGIGRERIVRVGNIMIDALVGHLAAADARRTWERFGVSPDEYAFLTLHRPGNVDDPERLGAIVRGIAALASELPVVFPVHPRTAERLRCSNLRDSLDAAGVRCTEPVGYLDSICLARHARLAVTDSGGLQAELAYLGTPCLTVRPSTEWTVTLHGGGNRLTEPERLVADARDVLRRRKSELAGRVPELWDGKTAVRIVEWFLGRAGREV